MRLSDQPYIHRAAIERRVAELGVRIAEDSGEGPLTAVVILKGALVFAADLIRAIDRPVQVEFMRARSYRGTTSSGDPEITVRADASVAGRRVLVIEDILDTGLTAQVILQELRNQRPASLKLCTLLDKPCRRIAPIEADYVGFTIENRFVVGYGLDYDENHRRLPDVYLLED